MDRPALESTQLSLFDKPRRRDPRGGAREGAGRKVVTPGRVGHKTRQRHPGYQPVHVTLRVRSELPGLRRWHLYGVLRTAFRLGNRRDNFSLVHYSVQSNHLHLICEADDTRALARGLQGLAIRAARALNKRLARRGPVFADRYFSRELTCPLQVKRALVYVFGNASHHGRHVHDAVDPYSSAAHFTGWKYPLPHATLAFAGSPIGRPPRTWLLSTGWLRHGRLTLRDGSAQHHS